MKFLKYLTTVTYYNIRVTLFRHIGIVAAFLAFTALTTGNPAYAQEINASVNINDSKISSSSTDHISDLTEQIEEYINRYDWTDDSFQEFERIQCNITITLQSVDDNYNFDANIVLSIKRPIYNTLQQTPILVISDNNWSFQYPPNSTFTHDKMQYDGIASLLDFYSYVILGLDYDTFSELGGTPHYQEARNILEIARTANASGWSKNSGSGRNRYRLINALTSTSYQDYRKGLYQYHRLGLDQFLESPKDARQEILNALENIREARRSTTRNYLFDILFSSKYKEMVSIFIDAEVDTRLEAYDLLTETDQSHSSEYEKLQ